MHNKVIYLSPFHFSFCCLPSPPCSFPYFSLLLFFAFLFHLLFSLSLTLIIGIFYCLNYTLHYYFISSQDTLYHIFLFHLLFSLSLRWLLASFTVLITWHFAITLSLYNTPCNRIYNNDENIFKEEQSIKILKILGLINNVG